MQHVHIVFRPKPPSVVTLIRRRLKIDIINMKHTARKKRIRPAIVLILLDFMIFPLIVYK